MERVLEICKLLELAMWKIALVVRLVEYERQLKEYEAMEKVTNDASQQTNSTLTR